MNEETAGLGPDFLETASEIVAAYVSNNHVAAGDLPAVIASVHAALAGLASGQATVPAEEPVERPSAAEIRKSVKHEGIVSFLDGRTYKTMKRHLTAHGLTPATYCERYGLPADYPMTAPSYSEQRSSLAKSIGLGVPGSRAQPTVQNVPTTKGRRKAA